MNNTHKNDIHNASKKTKNDIAVFKFALGFIVYFSAVFLVMPYGDWIVPTSIVAYLVRYIGIKGLIEGVRVLSKWVLKTILWIGIFVAIWAIFGWIGIVDWIGHWSK